jgi:hypothetical protein
MIHKIQKIEDVYNPKTNKMHKCVKCLKFEKYLIAAELKIVIGAMYVIDSFSSNPVQLYSETRNFLYFYDNKGMPCMVERERVHLVVPCMVERERVHLLVAELDSNEIVQISTTLHSFDTSNFYLEVKLDCERKGSIPNWTKSFYVIKRPFTLMLPGDPITITYYANKIIKGYKKILWQIARKIESIW